ncbi:zinc finger protein 184-like [Anopheles darlingi]|uniref:zinc finger protein 184-like n=1 Tax=Anopheles darlingi TaxID=43151 RepID=UPI0021002715|nr:zinc finger protein 184-like [Anopheles darlingi]
MDTLPSIRNAINDPNQCRLCMRVCEDSFLEHIFSDEEYSIAHQIFECTSIRVTKQDNLTKICKNCASLLFLTTEFRNACFKTNRLLMEDFVIMELGDWASDANRLLLRECESFIVRHREQVDYVYASIVTDSDPCLDGSLELGTELFRAERNSPAQRDCGDEPVRRLEAVAPLVPEEPDPEILMEISKFLEEQAPDPEPANCHGHGHTETRCILCRSLSEQGSTLTQRQLDTLRLHKLTVPSVDFAECFVCEHCCLLLDIMESFRKMFVVAQSTARHGDVDVHVKPSLEGLPAHAKALLQVMKQKQEAYTRHESVVEQTVTESDRPADSLSPIEKRKSKRSSEPCKRAKVTCHICGKQYDSWRLQTHLNEHDNVRPYVCDQAGCTSAFTGLVFLNRHKKLWHTDYYYAVCGVCGKQCKTQGIYQTHLSYHEEPKLPCTICGKLMRNKRAIWKHMKTHSNDRKHVCTVCNKRFTIAYTLRVHMRIHTNEKPYPCGQCDKRFQYKCLLKSHHRKHHEEALRME